MAKSRVLIQGFYLSNEFFPPLSGIILSPVNAARSLAQISRSSQSCRTSETSLERASSQSVRYRSTSALASSSFARVSSWGLNSTRAAASIASISSLKIGRDFLIVPFFLPASSDTESLVILVPLRTLIGLPFLRRSNASKYSVKILAMWASRNRRRRVVTGPPFGFDALQSL